MNNLSSIFKFPRSQEANRVYLLFNYMSPTNEHSFRGFLSKRTFNSTVRSSDSSTTSKRVEALHRSDISYLLNVSQRTRLARMSTTRLLTNQNIEFSKSCLKCPNHAFPTIRTNQAMSLHTLANSPNFRSMAGIQKLATEPTREHIENIRHLLRHMNAKDNDNQEITLHKDHETGIATVCIKSAAKNGISAKMMCDFLDVIDELYLWSEGKGVIIYGHGQFFCSGE